MQDDSKAREAFFKTLSQFPSIRFVEFVEHDDERDKILKFLSLNAGRAEQIISVCKPSEGCTNTAEWAKRVVIQMDIKGNFFFYFDDRKVKTPHPFPKLFLSDDYSWVEPLWVLCESFVFIPPDFLYYLFLLWEEEAYKAFLTYRKDIPEDID
jgi:hypothetical protein